MNLFALLLVSNAYWLHFITNFKVLYELNPLTIMTWRFNDHGLIHPFRQKVSVGIAGWWCQTDSFPVFKVSVDNMYVLHPTFLISAVK